MPQPQDFQIENVTAQNLNFKIQKPMFSNNGKKLKNALPRLASKISSL